MSRSKHTRPVHILAAQRTRAPYEPRRCGDFSTTHAGIRALKQMGIVAETSRPIPLAITPLLPKLYVQRPQIGFEHPATKADVVNMLRFFGEQCFYGLRSIELVQNANGITGGKLCFGRLVVPGRILLYAQKVTQWHLGGRLASAEQSKLERAGAMIERADEGRQTVIHWPEQTLREFMLFDVLMHEIGHHIIQQYKGKRYGRVVRTRDHEAFADYFAAHCRQQYSHLLKLNEK